MYYDPMISKLITWGPTRKDALELLYKAMDEYVIKGVTHNLGFGQSILRN
jgi:propionyl-CoA carboxylase alpha chain